MSLDSLDLGFTTVLRCGVLHPSFPGACSKIPRFPQLSPIIPLETGRHEAFFFFFACDNVLFHIGCLYLYRFAKTPPYDFIEMVKKRTEGMRVVKNHARWLGRMITGIKDFLKDLIGPLADRPS